MRDAVTRTERQRLVHPRPQRRREVPALTRPAGRVSPVPRRAPDRVPILNARFDRLTEQACVDEVWSAVRAGTRGWLCTVNVAILMMMRRDPALQSFVDRATWTVADGQPVVTLSRWLRRPLPERVTGIDLVERLSARAAREGVGVFLLGSTRSHVEAAAAGLRRRHPGLRVVGTADGYFPLDDAHERAARVARSGADILFVGMGVPRQEAFIERYWDALGASVVIGVGGSFDVLAGLRSRAPAWMRRISLEWLHRLAQEPGRLWKRYLVTNTTFLLLAARDVLRQRLSVGLGRG